MIEPLYPIARHDLGRPLVSPDLLAVMCGPISASAMRALRISPTAGGHRIGTLVGTAGAIKGELAAGRAGRGIGGHQRPKNQSGFRG